MLIQYRQESTARLLVGDKVGGATGNREWAGGGDFSGVTHLSCCSLRLHFKNATDKTEGIINHKSAKHTIARTLSVTSAGRVCLQAS